MSLFRRTGVIIMGKSFEYILLHHKTDLLSPHSLCRLAHSCFLCQFVCIAQQDYCCILNQVEKNMQKVEEEGEVVMVKEHRELDRTGTRKGHIVIKVRTQLRTSATSFHTQV